ncbi:hypothetical protein HMPREF3088_03755 [Corynebacterium sp. HMSC22B11]|uniref:DUF262 domain-containing protein n=1 Tax=Corynebacterium sp. HMSC22B11 TaxID=1581056 RepID=UPI0008A2430C|nr:DUF262 domain-containing protein [Corynebacterium sp. HMSC22B11]OFO15256.1 hypothetical protein HMPREF3088_03755 [Corynebacterium sp. HMSC22B11]
MDAFSIESKTVADFWGMHNRDELVLQPDYQRKVVWPQEAKDSLMESILLGYPIPEIYLEYATDAMGNQTVSVVDGQQRLSALIEYLSNEYSLDSLSDERTVEFHGKFFQDLPEETRTAFFQYTFPVRKLLNLKEESIREIFARVNRVNMTLTGQEIRNALLPGPFMEFLRDCASHSLNQTAGLFSVTRQMRGGDIEFYADVFGSSIFGISNKKKGFDERYDTLSADFESYSVSADRFSGLLCLIEKTVRWAGRTRWSNIVDMYTLLIVSYEHLKELEDLDHNGQLNLMTRALDHFQKAVNEKKRGDDEISELEAFTQTIGVDLETASGVVEKYESGIRNSSDLGARRNRSESLTFVMKEVFNQSSES